MAKIAGYEFTWGIYHIRIQGASQKDVCFSHEHPDIQTINITRLRQAIKDGTVKTVEKCVIFDPEQMRRVTADRDINPKRVKEILKSPEQYNEPVIIAIDSHTTKIPDAYTIDGSHRVYCHIVRKEYRVPAHLIAFKDLKPFKVSLWINGTLIQESRESIFRMFEYNKNPGSLH